MNAWTLENTGELCITSDSGLYSIRIPLHGRNGLYYCSSNTFAMDTSPYPSVCLLQHDPPRSDIDPEVTDNLTIKEIEQLQIQQQSVPTPKSRPKPSKSQSYPILPLFPSNLKLDCGLPVLVSLLLGKWKSSLIMLVVYHLNSILTHSPKLKLKCLPPFKSSQ